MWTITMFSGTCVLYASRASLPISAAAVAKEFAWNKTDSVRSSIFLLKKFSFNFFKTNFPGYRALMLFLGICFDTSFRWTDSRQVWSRKSLNFNSLILNNFLKKFQILPYSSLAWTMLTFFTPHLFDFAYWTNYPLVVLLAVRILTGVCQAFHIPSLASIVSKHLAAADKGRVFGIVLAGMGFIP